MDFNNTEIAFASKSKGELRNALLLFNVMKRPWIVRLGKWASSVALKIRFPIGWIVKPTLYRQFVGGETIDDCKKVVARLAASGVCGALDYSAEAEKTPEGILATFEETKRSIENAAVNENIPYAIFKPSTLTTDALLSKVSEKSGPLTPAEEKE